MDDYISIQLSKNRAPDEVHIFVARVPRSSPNPMFDPLLESSHRDDSNKRSNIGFGEEMTQVVSIEVNYIHLIWSSAQKYLAVSSYLFLLSQNLQAVNIF